MACKIFFRILKQKFWLIQFALWLLSILFLPVTIPLAQSSEKLPSIVKKSLKPSVLVLHSYHHGFTWSDKISKGILSVLKEHDGRIEVIFEFMDTRRIHTEEYFQKLKNLYKTKYVERKIDVIICSDDHAFNFILENGEDIFPNVPIVFCSVSGYKLSMRQGREITGLQESIDIQSTLDIALKLHADTKEIAVITDMTRTGQTLKIKAEEVFRNYKTRVKFRYLENMTIEDLQDSVASFSEGTLVFLFIFSRDKTGRIFSHEQNLEILAQKCKVPIYAVWEFYLGHGIVGGKLTSGVAEGRMTGEMANRIIQGENASDIPLQKSPVQYMFDYQQLERFNIQELNLPKGSIIINRPFSFYKTYKNLIWGATTVIVVLLIIIGILFQNIIMKRRAEDALVESEERYRLLADNVTDVIWTRDMNLNLTYISPSVKDQQGFTVDEAMARPPQEAWTPDSFKRNMEMLKEEVEIEKRKQKDMARSRMVESEVKCKDGSTIWTEAKISFLRNPNGEPIGIIGVTRDITGRKQMEGALQQSEERYRSLVENTIYGFFIHEIPSGRFLFLNQRACDLYGYTMREGLELTVWDVLSSEDHEHIKNRIQARVESKKLGPDIQTYTAMRKDGSTFRLEVSSSLIIFQDRPAVQGIVRDVTEKERLEHELKQAQKMESIGTLAGGIAHDFNNILSSVFGFTELALDDAKKGTLQHEHLQEVLRAGNRAKDLVKQILTFSRQVDQEQKPIQVKPIVKEALKLLRASIPTTIDIKKNVQSNSLVIGDSTQIHQVLMNLCTNAAHAMEDDGGVLTVSLSDVELDSEFVSNHPDLKPGAYINLTVSDTGHGISPDVMEKIFDPFYTTKEKGKGTGMGLAVVHGIVRGHGGDIYVYSEPGKGSNFKVYLPAMESRLKPEEKIDSPIPTGTERILFIDDEPVIVNMGKQILKSLGYNVTTRTSSIEALELFKAQKDRFDLVITDMTMPQMTGDNLAKELMQIRFDIPVILCTGFSSRIDEQKALGIGIRAFVSKPILKREIADAIRRVLES